MEENYKKNIEWWFGEFNAESEVDHYLKLFPELDGRLSKFAIGVFKWNLGKEIDITNPAAARKAKAAIRKAFENSKKDKGTSFVEIVSTCNSGWKLDPVQANKWMVENMFPKYPLGDMKDI